MKNPPFLFAIILFCACSSNSGNVNDLTDGSENPPVENFNQEASDPRAIEIADRVMEAMGGREAWDQTRIIAWNFFGRRDLVWDKKTGDVRIDSPGDTTVYLININKNEGMIFRNGEEITEPEEKARLIERGRSIWINDSYWLCMPFKLKDPGVTLEYLREDTTRSGLVSDVLQLTFDGVGMTPDNKYEVWVDRSDNLIKQWAYFRNASQDTASAVWPFDNYRKYGNLLLSADRSDDRGPSNVRVYDSLDMSVFSDPGFRDLPVN